MTSTSFHIRRGRGSWRGILVATLSLAVLALPACAGSRVAGEKQQQQGNAAGGTIPELNLPTESDASMGSLVNYNPFAVQQTVRTWLFEPLMQQSSLDCKVVPWLATGYSWESPSKLVFTIRQGVKWSDGSPFSAKDVAFTYNLTKKYPSIDLAGVWNDTFGPKGKSVTADGDKVTFEFEGPAATKFPYLIGQKIVSEKEFGPAGDPAKYVSKTPISTGPFKVATYNGRRLELERRPDYWQADKIKVQKLVLEGNYDANQAAAKLKAGELDFYSGEIPNPQKAFVAADPKTNHVWYAPNGLTVLAPNLTKKPFDDVKFREALAYGMDKQSATQKATYGLMKVASQSGLPLPEKDDLLPAKYPANSTVIPFDQAKAGELLDAAGYRKGSNGLRQNPDGSPLKITFSVQAGWIDYEAMADELTSNFRKLGLDITANKMPPEAVDQQKKSGNFQLMINYMGAGCDYAHGMGATVSTAEIPDKTTIKGNVGRYTNPAVDKAIGALAAATDEAATKEQVGVLVDAMMTDYPVLPILYAPARAIYRTDHAVGWPSAEDPYANPQDQPLVWITHLTAPPSK
ncbi:ABC transporter substrate-binding protein [Kribbella shirazensis]|uniref:Peptide/nickel transport system substrate-binding protein n=1 Tax=Kribbella shirazensis TaxID=1105143 RepID=A0A7X5VIH9_9ACTN|nr:ABC transporter substrate-binding protein [Kribbella shirazensis]NIK61890.1 peptide/nickel transport system substrate-binding protein [Kribbella shirazensis]